MSPDERYPNRQSIRYKGHDYASAGAYFVTVCTKNRAPLLVDTMLAAIVTDVWYALPDWFPTIALDEFVIMPNHVHFVVWLGVDPNRSGNVTTGGRKGMPLRRDGGRLQDGGRPRGSPLRGGYVLPACETPRVRPTLGDVVGTWKSLVVTVYIGWIEKYDPARRAKCWQRNYYDRIVRHERGLQAIRDYIFANPARWPHDPDNPKNLAGLRAPQTIDEYLDDVRRFYRQQKATKP